MKRAVSFVVTAICLLAASSARATQESQRLYSRGLVEFHAERYAQAQALFEQAVTADPEDTTALYYRGVSRGHLGDSAGAIADFRAVLAQKPYLDVAALDLGVMLVQTGQYQDAVRWLMQAQRDKDLDARASLFLGLAQLRLGQLEEARRNFQHAAVLDPQQGLAARYYEGIVDYRESNWSAAEQHFSYVTTTDPDSDVGHEAATFLSKVRELRPPPYTVYGLTGFQYDSNVSLAPSSQATAIQTSNQADGLAIISFGGTYVPWRVDWLQLNAGYDFFESFHFREGQIQNQQSCCSNYNILDNGENLQLIGKAGPVRFGLLGRYDYYMLQQSYSFLQEANALPWVTILDDRGRTELYFRFRRRDFKRQVFYVNDGLNYAPGIRQFFYLNAPERYIWVGYQYDNQVPVVNTSRLSQAAKSSCAQNPDLTPSQCDQGLFEQYGYAGNQAEVGIGWAFPYAITAEASYAYRHENYNDASELFFKTPSPVPRADNISQIIVVAHKQLGEYLDLSAAYYGTINNSNNPLYEYDRNIASLTLGVRF